MWPKKKKKKKSGGGQEVETGKGKKGNQQRSQHVCVGK